MKLDCYLSLYISITSKWTVDLSIRPEIIKYKKENIGPKLMDLGLREDFMNLTLKARNQSKTKWIRLYKTKKLQTISNISLNGRESRMYQNMT